MTEDDLGLLVSVRAAARAGAARRARLSAGVTQAEIASTCGVAPVTVAMWETGRRTPRGEPALRYGRVLRMLAARAPVVRERAA